MRIVVADMIGKTFGKRKVLRRVAGRPGDRHVHVRCICSCGEHSTVRASYLIAGRSVRCMGCEVRSRGGREEYPAA